MHEKRHAWSKLWDERVTAPTSPAARNRPDRQCDEKSTALRHTATPTSSFAKFKSNRPHDQQCRPTYHYEIYALLLRVGIPESGDVAASLGFD